MQNKLIGAVQRPDFHFCWNPLFRRRGRMPKMPKNAKKMPVGMSRDFIPQKSDIEVTLRSFFAVDDDLFFLAS